MLTDAHCRNATCPPERKQARFSDSGGLYLQVSPNGSKRWFLKYRTGGKEKQLALGSYPDVGLTAARKARDAAKLQKAAGLDPVQARKVEKLKATNPAGDTFQAVALEWHAKQAPQWSEGHAERALRQLERDLFPWIGPRRLSEIEPVELLATLRKIEDGSYGFCEDTGEPIGLKRLLARPTASLSVEAQERRERLKKQFAD